MKQKVQGRRTSQWCKNDLKRRERHCNLAMQTHISWMQCEIRHVVRLTQRGLFYKKGCSVEKQSNCSNIKEPFQVACKLHTCDPAIQYQLVLPCQVVECLLPQT